MREIPTYVMAGEGSRSLNAPSSLTAELTADWKVSASPIEKMSPRNQITASTRVDATGAGWLFPVCSRIVPARGRRKRPCRDRHGVCLSAIKRYWSSLPSGRSNLQRLVRNENGVIPRLRASSIHHFALLVRETSSFRESILSESASENIGRNADMF